jgi:hypothetical protein
MDDDLGFFETFLGDGRSLIKLTALALIGAGAFALFQASTGQFLPQDTDYLGMTAAQLCALRGCRIVHFMIHDRVSFGGVLMAIGILYLWRRRETWAWWALLISGSAGFLSFLAYLGYGYLDSWHGAATLALLPLFATGLMRTRALRVEQVPRAAFEIRSRPGVGRILLLMATFGIIAAGLTIMTVGMTSVFVPTDIVFMGITPAELRHVNPHLVPLIAHDRAGFGGALVSCGLAMFLAVLYGTPSRNLWQALTAAGVMGFCAAIAVHPLIGYTDLFHLGPAIAGCVVFFLGIAITMPGRLAAPAVKFAP